MPKLRPPKRVTDYADELRHIYGGMMTVTDVMKEIGADSMKTAKKYLDTVPAYDVNGRKKYRVTDVARRVFESEI